MGALRAMDIAEGFDLEQGISLHLTSNHYPPVPIEMVPVCIDAIDAVNSESDWDKLITLPDGISWKGLHQAPASAIIEQHHLEFWIVESELGE
jgi:hypothetical protein